MNTILYMANPICSERRHALLEESHIFTGRGVLRGNGNEPAVRGVISNPPHFVVMLYAQKHATMPDVPDKRHLVWGWGSRYKVAVVGRKCERAHDVGIIALFTEALSSRPSDKRHR